MSLSVRNRRVRDGLCQQSKHKSALLISETGTSGEKLLMMVCGLLKTVWLFNSLISGFSSRWSSSWSSTIPLTARLNHVLIKIQESTETSITTTNIWSGVFNEVKDDNRRKKHCRRCTVDWCRHTLRQRSQDYRTCSQLSLHHSRSDRSRNTSSRSGLFNYWQTTNANRSNEINA